MGRETDNGFWKSKPTIIFSFDMGGKHYVFSLTDIKWFIKQLLPNGKMGSETDNGSWNNYYTLGFPFSINGRQYFYCISDKYWFIQELLSGGKMGIETDNGHWTTNHILHVPFSIDGKYYFYGLTENDDKKSWFMQELLPGGRMGTEKTQGCWEFYYALAFSYNINGRQFFYGLSEYYWLIQEIIQEPRFPVVTTTRKKYCKRVLRTKRQNNSGTCNAGCRGLNGIEEYITDIENDDDNYDTINFANPRNPLRSVSTFRVLADANHNRDIELTAAMRAEIHYNHMPPVRDTISSEVHDHLRQMDRQNDDEAGHLLASSLGGSGATFNFAPQSPMLNRAANVPTSVIPQPGWYDVEEMLREYLIEMNSGYIRWNLAPQYSLLPNSRRPTAFLLSIRFYDDHDNLVNWRMEGAVRSYNFPNVPTVACTNPNHPWWNH
ncbi:hypothetical protein JTB14_026719 [Gonioctena quinquepunctata]|nr:hypothetical protein JTB14_026719 [Gonioctena quinquepunctata]